ncbi:ATP-binding protein [Actinoplanes sp. TRM 88003]|uniref:ATP-binding protein n=1 Tax=Paractinoplanes aksuensis TaxID=2939490 RepID=A0ABT1E451_9ACTN|nr:ATP-binding protein [Actinoplanes aksuensis]MCO8277904.1 ATP-binding protein [Actinoplanes aksuensis]
MTRVRPAVLRALRRRASGLIFVVGEHGSGRTATLTAFAAELRRDDEPPAVLTHRFAGEPPAHMVAALLDQCPQAVGPLAGRHLDEPGDLLALLRIATRERPVVFLLDDFSRSDLVWWRLFLRDGEAELARMPLLIVAALDAVDGPDVRHQDLVAGLESWFASTVRMDPVLPAELEKTVGSRIAEPLRTHVFELVGGAAGRVEDLWHELLDDGAIEAGPDEWNWRWGGPENCADFVRTVFDRRIRECCATPQQRELAWAVLRMAALEGVEFTPSAVAAALHRLGVAGCDDPDGVVDFIDDVLAGPDLLEVDDVARFVYRARFTRPGHAEALRRFGLDDEERRRWAAALGPAYAAPELTDRRRRGLMRAEAAGPLDHRLHAEHLMRRAAEDPWQAVELSRQALREAERSGSADTVTRSLVAVAETLWQLDRFAEARTYAARAGAHRPAQVVLASCHIAIAEDGDLAEAARLADGLLATAGSDLERQTARALRAQVEAAELVETGALSEARDVLLATPAVDGLRLLRAIADRLGDTAIADELAHLMLVRAWGDTLRRARAEQDAEVARLSAALDDLGPYLRALHDQA